MLMPSIFGENLFDDFFGDFPFYYDDRAMKDTEKKLYGRRASHIMKTDIKETDKGYELVVDLPGFTKDEVKADLENGYLTISAEKGLDKDEQENDSVVAITNPSWENHRALFESAGFPVQNYSYYDAATHGIDRRNSHFFRIFAPEFRQS